MVGYVLEFAVIVLLSVTIGYAARLSGKLNILKNQKEDFANNINAFQAATEAAIVAVQDLHMKGEAVCKLIDEKISKAGLMGDDIEFITDRARKHLIGLRALDSKVSAPASRPAGQIQVVNSLAEAQLVKALREREFRDAMNG